MGGGVSLRAGLRFQSPSYSLEVILFRWLCELLVTVQRHACCPAATLPIMMVMDSLSDNVSCK